MSESQSTSSQSEIITMTIQPGFAEWETPLIHYVARKNFGSSMTIYTLDNKGLALIYKKRLETEGYIVHLEYPNGTSTITPHTVIHDGISLK